MSATAESNVINWHLDRRVTVALILALLTQTGSTIWWASAMNQRMNSVENTVTALASQAVVDVRITALHAQVAECKDFHNRLESKLDRVLFSRKEEG